MDERAKKEFEKENAQRTFALKESPVRWKTIEDLKLRIQDYNGKLNKLKRTFDDLEMTANEDNDYISEVMHARRAKTRLSGVAVFLLANVGTKRDLAYICAEQIYAALSKAKSGRKIGILEQDKIILFQNMRILL